jgi:hypothetical protein
MNYDDTTARPVKVWPVALLALPAFVAIWSGWVGLGGLTGFGKVNPLPGTPLADWSLDTAITLPIGMEVYAAFALRVWLSGHLAPRATRFAKWSAIGSLLLGAAGQVAYHLMTAAQVERAPWWITTIVACLPVAVLGMGAALAHLIRDTAPIVPVAVTDEDVDNDDAPEVPEAATVVPAPTRAPRVPSTTAAKPTGTSARTARPARRAGNAGDRVRRLRAQHPEWTVARIAERAGVSERTARRHLNAPSTGGTSAPSTADPDADLAA